MIPVQLASVERLHGAQRIAVRLVDRGVEVALERRTLDGWDLRRRIVLALDELSALTEAFTHARDLAGAVHP